MGAGIPIAQRLRKMIKTDGDYFTSNSGLNIRYRLSSATAPLRGHMLILPGFTEFIEKYEDQMKRFSALGFHALVLDWPSQGLSQRLNPKYPKLVHCDDFSQHMSALDAVLDVANFIDREQPLFVFGHSMGGHLALRFVQSRPWVRGVILSAPMMMPPVKPAVVIKPALDLLVQLGAGGLPIPFRQDERVVRDFHPENVLTRDPDGYQIQFEWFRKNPELRVTGPSFGWARAAYQSCFEVTANREALASIQVPVQAHLAGDERVVSSEHSHRFLPYLPQATLFQYNDARHELMLETPDVRDLIWTRIEDFLKQEMA